MAHGDDRHRFVSAAMMSLLSNERTSTRMKVVMIEMPSLDCAYCWLQTARGERERGKGRKHLSPNVFDQKFVCLLVCNYKVFKSLSGILSGHYCELSTHREASHHLFASSTAVSNVGYQHCYKTSKAANQRIGYHYTPNKPAPNHVCDARTRKSQPASIPRCTRPPPSQRPTRPTTTTRRPPR